MRGASEMMTNDISNVISLMEKSVASVYYRIVQVCCSFPSVEITAADTRTWDLFVMATGCTDSVRLRSGNSDRLAAFAAEPKRVRKNGEESGYYFVRNILKCPFLGLPGRRRVSVRGEDQERCCSLNKPVYENMISKLMFECVLYLMFLAIHGQRKHAALRVSRKLGKKKKKN